MRFQLSAELLQALREARRLRRLKFGQDEVEDEHDAFLLYPGMGPMLYLTHTGVVLVDERSWDGEAVREAKDDYEAIGALVVGAKITGIASLLDLVPPKPVAGQSCPKCSGSRWMRLGAGEMVCVECSGRGWVT